MNYYYTVTSLIRTWRDIMRWYIIIFTLHATSHIGDDKFSEEHLAPHAIPPNNYFESGEEKTKNRLSLESPWLV